MKNLFPNVEVYAPDEVELDTYKIVAERFGNEEEALFKNTISWAFNRAFFYPPYRRFTAPMDVRGTYIEPYKLWLDDMANFANKVEEKYGTELAAYVRELARAEVQSYIEHENFMIRWQKEKAEQVKKDSDRSWARSFVVDSTHTHYDIGVEHDTSRRSWYVWCMPVKQIDSGREYDVQKGVLFTYRGSKFSSRKFKQAQECLLKNADRFCKAVHDNDREVLGDMLILFGFLY